ncbi:helix-turn-helix transcriptional regulator [Canicola haemoglobinophilus]|uniref:helix-turn-helix domain-containing protein n=1 Tax=Canicola haemoglobinophilus TaxID=733 RepID=UPI002E25EDEE
MSELSGIPYRSVQNYLRNEREPNVEALTKLKETMNIDVNWLLTGEGKMFQGLPSDELAEKSKPLSIIIDKCRMMFKGLWK